MAYRHVSVWLEDVAIAINRIKTYIRQVETRDVLEQEQMVVDATERNLKKIAEALKNAVKEEPALPITDVRKIIDLRNLINHSYFKVNKRMIWEIITSDLQVLVKEVRVILDEYERQLGLKDL